jgi:hypothetical protein
MQDSTQLAALLSRLEATEAAVLSQLSGSISAAGALLSRGEELAGAAAAAGGAIEERVTALLGASAGVEARVMGLERWQATLQQVRGVTRTYYGWSRVCRRWQHAGDYC